jgi:TolC family type I secretion outer membrane protein
MSGTRLALLAILAAVLIAGGLGCTGTMRDKSAKEVAEDPATPWTPPEKALAPAEAPRQPTEIPAEFLESKAAWTLQDIVDLALRNNPETRATWASARAAAANVGSEWGAYLPQITGTALYSRAKSSFSQNLNVERKYFAPGLDLHFVLFDFGKRSGNVQQARQALYAANWSHNAMIQDVVLEVERTYYQYLYSKALRDAANAAVEEATTNLDAAKDRQQSGLATVADVLQAQSLYAQRKLALQTVEGQIQTIRGSLATAMGLSPTLEYDVGLLPSDLPVEEVSQTVEELIEEAETYRPDLAAARAAAEGARAHVKSIKGERWPEISVDGNVSRWFYDSWDNHTDNYGIGIFLTVPLFTGFSNPYDVVKAEAEADLARQRYETSRSSVELDVWTSYYDLKTASERLATAREFLDSATESHAVAVERYQSGVGTILELLSAQTTLEEARAQDVQSRTDWFLAVAQLAHATGRLGTPKPIPAVKTKTETQGD